MSLLSWSHRSPRRQCAILVHNLTPDVSAVRICYRLGWGGGSGNGSVAFPSSQQSSTKRLQSSRPADRSSRTATPDLMPVPRRIRRRKTSSSGVLSRTLLADVPELGRLNRKRSTDVDLDLCAGAFHKSSPHEVFSCAALS